MNTGMLSTLPSELIIHIFSYFPGEEISRFNQLNKFYKELIGNNQHCLSRPVVDFNICGDVFRSKVIVYLQHKQRKWKYISEKQKKNLLAKILYAFEEDDEDKHEGEVDAENDNDDNENDDNEEEHEREAEDDDDADDDDAVSVSSSSSSSSSWSLSSTSSYEDISSIYRNDEPTQHNLLPLFEFILHKADIKEWRTNSKYFTSLLTQALNKTSGRVLRVNSFANEIDYDLLKAIGSKKFADKKYPIMKITLSGNKEDTTHQDFWSKAEIINEIAFSYGYALLRFNDMDYGIAKIAEMWANNGCPNINLHPEVKAPWFFEEWNISTYRQIRPLEASLDETKQSLLLKYRDRGMVLRFDKIFSTQRGIHDIIYDHLCFLFVSIKVYYE